jgi:hypothetical protein
MASNAAMWQRITVSSVWFGQNRPQSQRLCPSTMLNSQTLRRMPGSTTNSTWNSAKSTCACWPGAVSKRRSNCLGAAGRISRRYSVSEE